MKSENIIVVDLDGTLIKTDLLWESVLLLIKKNVLFLFLLPIWILKGGRAQLKLNIARQLQIAPATLPYNASVLSF